MKIKDIVSQLANRINQPHVIEVFLRQVYAKGFVDGTKQSQWISVKERLPQKGEVVNVKLKDGRFTHSWILGDGMWAFNLEPTHWVSITD